MNAQEKIEKALEIAARYGQIKGDRYRVWTIDQMVRALAGDDYYHWVEMAKEGCDGPNTYDWETGIAP